MGFVKKLGNNRGGDFVILNCGGLYINADCFLMTTDEGNYDRKDGLLAGKQQISGMTNNILGGN